MALENDFFGKDTQKTGEFSNLYGIFGRGMIITLKSGFLLFFKKARKVPFLTEEDYENAVFNSKTKRRLSPFSQPFFLMPKTNVSALLRGILPKKTYSKYNQSTEAGTSFFLECVFFRFLSLTERKKYRIFEVSCSVAQR